MAYISFQPSDYFNTKLYTGNGSTQSISSVGFQPDWVWLKRRDATTSNEVYDAVRTATKRLKTDSTAAEDTDASFLTSFDSDGFSLGNHGGINNNTNTYVSWNWKANGSGSSNSDGSITSTVSASPTSGFSIVKWTGDGSTSTIGHGIGRTPTMIITKRYDSSGNWFTYHHRIGNTKYLLLEATDVEATSSGAWNNTTPTSSVFTKGSGTNVSGGSYIAYCFADTAGHIKTGLYEGTGNSDGNYQWCGFSPNFIMIKAKGSAKPWQIYDAKRVGYNPDNNQLNANSNAVEATNDFLDILSNGFKVRTTDSTMNSSGQGYIWIAIAENPLVSSNGVPATAR
jgi:hypothetical protein